MSTKATTIVKNKFDTCSYSYSRAMVPYPESPGEKMKPPTGNRSYVNNNHLFEIKEKSYDERKQEFMDNWNKAERSIVVGFYTGGGKYTRGALDAIYRGFNPGAQPAA